MNTFKTLNVRVIPNTLVSFKRKCCHNFRKGDPPHNPKIAYVSCLDKWWVHLVHVWRYIQDLIGKKSPKHTQFSQIWSSMKISNNPVKYEVLVKQYLHSILDISACVAGKVRFNNHLLALMVKMCRLTFFSTITKDLSEEHDQESSIACSSQLSKRVGERTLHLNQII